MLRFRVTILLSAVLFLLPAAALAAYPTHLFINGHQHAVTPGVRHALLTFDHVLAEDELQMALHDQGLMSKVEWALPAAWEPSALLTFNEGERIDDPVIKDALYTIPGLLRVLPAPLYEGSSPFLPTGIIAVEFSTSAAWSEAKKLLNRYPVTIMETMSGAARTYIARFQSAATDPVEAINLANAIAEENPKLVVMAEADYIKRIIPMARPNDTYYYAQWHLNNTGSWMGYSNGTSGADVDAEMAWAISTGTTSTVIALFDDGQELSHPDLGSKTVNPHDLLDGDNNPTPPCSYGHGVSCAGVAAAQGNNGAGVSGLCQNCKVSPWRMIGSSGLSDYTLGNGFKSACDLGVAVISNSWGYDDHSIELSSYLKNGIDYCTNSGRGGLGVVFTWASGNGNAYTGVAEYIYDTEMQCYTRVLTVGASNQNDGHSEYSNYGPALDIVAPSNDNYGWSIVTTDYSGSCGYNNNGNYYAQTSVRDIDTGGNYTAYFGGTSSATPLVAGLAGLIISVNPALYYWQVMDIIRNTADKVGGVTYNSSGHNDYMGHGRINAYRALVQAQSGAGCGDLTFQGQCVNNIAMWCDNNTLVTDDCTEDVLDCGLGTDNLYRCLPCQATAASCRDEEDNDCDKQVDEPDECSGTECYPELFTKSCQGDQLVSCTLDRLIELVNCVQYGMSCGYDTNQGVTACMVKPCEVTANSCTDGVNNDCDSETDEKDECNAGQCYPTSFVKSCQGDNLVTCPYSRVPELIDCTGLGLTCGMDDGSGQYACVSGSCVATDPSCTDNRDNDCDRIYDEQDECNAGQCWPASYQNYCESNILHFCDTTKLPATVDCAGYDLICGDSTLGKACVAPGCIPSALDCYDNIDNDCDRQVDEADECPQGQCDAVTYTATCLGTILSFCNGGYITATDCTIFGQVCGYNEASSRYQCIDNPNPCTITALSCTDSVDNDCDTQTDEPDECAQSGGCGQVTAVGVCIGSFAYYCANNAIQQVNCSMLDMFCGEDSNGYNRCVRGLGVSGGSCASFGGGGLLALVLAGLAARRRRGAGR